MNTKCIISLWILLITAIVSCRTNVTLDQSTSYIDLSKDIKYSVMLFPQDRYNNIVRINDQVIAAFIAGDNPSKQDYILSGQNIVLNLGLPQDKECVDRGRFSEYLDATELPDGRIGFVKRCIGGDLVEKTVKEMRYLIALDWETRQVTQLVTKPLPDSRFSGCFSWNPNMSRGVQAATNFLVGTIYWITPNGTEPIQSIITDANQSWNMASSYGNNGSTTDARVSCPSWSPDGRVIAFFASFDAIGKEGLERLDQSFNLILYFPGDSYNNGKYKSILRGIYDPIDLQWSPDSRKLAFAGKTKNGVEGFWLVDVETGQLYLVDKGWFRDFTWLSSSTDVATLSCSESEFCQFPEIRNYIIETP